MSMTGTYVLDELSILDLTTFTWSKRHTVPPRYNHSATLIGSKLYIYAGKDEQGTTVSDLFSIDLSTPGLHPHQVLGCHYGGSGQLVLLKSQHFCEAVCGKLLVFGRYLVNDGTGASGSGVSSSTSVAGSGTGGSVYGLWLLDLSTLEWKKMDCSGSFDTGGWNYFTVTEDISSGPSRSSRSSVHSLDLSSHAQDDLPDHLLFLGNTDPIRPQGYDHFRDMLLLPAETLGLYSIPPARISHDFGRLLDNPELSDFVIVPSDRREIHVHQIILMSRWPHFRNVHNSGMIESTHHRMEIPEPHDVVLAFLRYLYTDTVDEYESWEVVADVLVLANMYLLHRLKKICCDLLYRHHMRVETCARIFEKAVIAQEHGLKQLALEFIFRNYGGVLKAQVLTDLSPGVTEEFLDAVPEGAVLEVKGRAGSAVVGAWEGAPGQLVGNGGGMKVLAGVGLGVGV
ncbi:hypothetical protein BC938DRAFT_476720 [Jimgerdemannia flammicorona]|uniref:BTB domain-containing protein n=1 Tax=Jimgerdemannia flammicorona TaxID=994334 RepID=A0A433PEU3_9FUNG|nr:hypothetical protein BC938DRAFT_476720 [Jimgerdemannia flammicorona]